MALYKIRIYDLHEYPELMDNELWLVPKDIEWKVFHFVFDTAFINIVAFRSFALFGQDGEVTECTKVYLSDGQVLYATNKLETFEANYTNNYTKEEPPTG